MAENQLQKGSRLERQKFIAKFRRMIREIDEEDECSECFRRQLTQLLAWGLLAEKRADAKKSGL